MEKVFINMGCSKTIREIINNVDSGVYNIVDEENRNVSIIVEKNKKLETHTQKEDGWVLTMEYNEHGEVVTESLIKNT